MGRIMGMTSKEKHLAKKASQRRKIFPSKTGRADLDTGRFGSVLITNPPACVRNQLRKYQRHGKTDHNTPRIPTSGSGFHQNNIEPISAGEIALIISILILTRCANSPPKSRQSGG